MQRASEVERASYYRMIQIIKALFWSVWSFTPWTSHQHLWNARGGRKCDWILNLFSVVVWQQSEVGSVSSVAQSAPSGRLTQEEATQAEPGPRCAGVERDGRENRPQRASGATGVQFSVLPWYFCLEPEVQCTCWLHWHAPFCARANHQGVRGFRSGVRDHPPIFFSTVRVKRHQHKLREYASYCLNPEGWSSVVMVLGTE